MDLRQVDGNFAVSPQLSEADIAAVAAAGYRTVICNRPDGEEPGQPTEATMRKAATDAGIEFHFVPVSGHQFPEAALKRFAEIRREAEGPTLAYCRSGTRSIMLETLANPEDRSEQDRLARAQSAGYDLSGLQGHPSMGRRF